MFYGGRLLINLKILTQFYRYLNCLCDYEATFNSAASKYAMESLAEFEVIFMNDIVNQSEDFKKITPLQFRTLVEVKNKLMNHRNGNFFY